MLHIPIPPEVTNQTRNVRSGFFSQTSSDYIFPVTGQVLSDLVLEIPCFAITGRNFGWNFSTITADRRKKVRNRRYFEEKWQRLQPFLGKFPPINYHPYLKKITAGFVLPQSLQIIFLPLSFNINSENLQFWASSTTKSKGWENVNQVVGKCCLPPTKFADDGNSSPYISNWMLSARGHNVAHLTGSTTRTWLPEDPKTA